MNKMVFLFRGTDSENYAQFQQRISMYTASLLKHAHPQAIKFTITEKAPPAFSLIPFSRKKIAAISMYNGHETSVETARQMQGYCGAYLVEEALPLSYTIHWPIGTATPGVCLFTFFCRKKQLADDVFIHRWHNIHSSHSLQIHPLWNYVRNVVIKKMTEDSIAVDGIVEEQMREKRDLLNPFRFWGNPLVILPRMLKELYDTKSFIDFGSMETYLAAEYWLKRD